ncbi:hypothetical protein C9374_000525 [Naegleria lovaniensis]|uniref:PUL domain-containing protein n=1 Tax=Naegleria lovaniensis TaxID=51637 RepID=A0AA88KP77_NAELO|nr:uncharacterized protein C9374_000525 [Naegleria lovaniensis]KAG2388361.1 hypothetical protein C9374_000525 [Naegleria lovaniensis]
MLQNTSTTHSESERKFVGKLISSQQQSQQYADENLKSKARSLIPVDRIHQNAQEKFKFAKERDPNSKPLLERMIIQELLNWFKGEFFKWVNNPPCDYCQSTRTQLTGGTVPNFEESANLAGMVELYSCQDCNKMTRFPRYNYVGKLLETRRGRCGEWAQCFTLCARALGYDSRFVLDWTDHVWTEVFLDGSWVHCDSCEGVLDSPLMYESGWQKKLSYVIAFSVEEVVDVTKRYTQHFYDNEFQKRRRDVGISEEFLLETLRSLNSQLQIYLPPYRATFIKKKQEKEMEELENKQKQSISEDDLKDEEKRGRISGSQEWREARGESGKQCEPGASCSVPQFAMDKSITETLESFSHVQDIITSKRNSIICLGSSKIVNDNIVLTEDKTDQVGMAVLNEEFALNEDVLISFKFLVRKASGTGADGFAFLLHSNPQNNLGMGGSGLGYEGIPNSIAIEFDTYQTVDRTRDPNSNHISIQTRYNQPNSANHDYSLCCPSHLPITIGDGLPHTCKILIQNNKLTVILDDKYLFLKDFVIDFQRILGNGGKFKIAFTGATGGLSEEHTILSWTVSYKTPKSNNEHSGKRSLSLDSYILFEQGNVSGIEKKFREFCALESSTSISEQQIQNLLNLSSWKMVDCSLAISIIKQWKFDHLFPVIDLLRLAVINNKAVAQTFSKLFIQNQKDHLLLSIFDRLKVANETNSYSYCLLTLRLLNNMFTEKLSRVYVNKFSETILEQLCENKLFSAHSNKASVRNVWITTFFNLSLLFTKELPSEEMTLRLFNIVYEFLEKECTLREDIDESCCVMALKAFMVLLKIGSTDSLKEESMLHGLALSMNLAQLLTQQLATKFSDTQTHAQLHDFIHTLMQHLE